MSYEQTNQDLLYIEDGYLTPDGYYVYIALAQVALGPYIDEGYIDPQYYEDYSVVGSLVCSGDIITNIEGEAALSAAFTQTTAIDKIKSADSNLSASATVSATVFRTQEGSSTQSMTASLSATVFRTQEGSSTQSAAFTQSALTGKIVTAAISAGALFTPSMTVNAQLAGVALLEAPVTLTITPAVNRATSIALETIGNLNSQAVKTVDIQSTQSTSFTQVSNGTKTVSPQSTLNSAFTVNSDALIAILASAQLSARASVYASRYTGTGRPRHLDGSAGEFDSSIKKFGTHSGLGVFGTGFDQENLIPSKTTDWRFETWVYPTQTSGSIISIFDFFTLSWFTSSGVHRKLRLQIETLSTATVDYTTGSAADVWHHICVIKDSTGHSVYLNGTRVIRYTIEPEVYEYQGRGLTTAINLGRASNYIDETALWIGTTLGNSSADSSITVPTEAFANDPDYTAFLYHFDNNNLDDIAVQALGQAALAVTGQLTAQANANTKQGSATLSAQITQATSAVKLVSGSAAFPATATVTADVDKFRPAEATLSAQASVSATVGVIKPFLITVDSLFTPVMTVNAQRAGVALLETTVTLSATVVKTTDVISTQSAAFTQTAQAVKTTDVISTQSAEFAQSTVGQRIRFGQSALQTTATVTVDIGRVKQGEAAVTATATVTADVDKLKLAAAGLSSTAALTATVVKTTDVISTESAQFTVTADTVRVRFAASTQAAEFTQSTVSVKTTDVISTQSAAFTQSTAAVKTARGQITAGALFTPSLTAVAQFAGVALLESSSSLTVIIGSIKQFEPTENFGVRSYSHDRHPRLLMSFERGTFDEIAVKENGFLLSFWARRHSITGNFQPMIATEQETFAFTWRGNNILLRQNFDPDDAVITWSGVSTDTDWHHYLFYTYATGAGTLNTYHRLWIDGQYQGQQQFPAISVESQVFNSGDYLEFGSATLAELSAPYSESSWGTAGDFAQIWIGSVTQNNTAMSLGWPPVSSFYDDGYIDLSSTGRGSLLALPQPLVYDPLTKPYNTVTFAGTYATDDKPALQSLGYDWAQAVSRINTEANVVLVTQTDLSTAFALVAGAVKTVNPSATLSAQATQTTAAEQRIGIVALLATTVTQTTDQDKFTGYSAAITSTASLSAIAGFFEFADSALASTATLEIDVFVKPPIRTEANLSGQFTVTADVQSFTDSITLMVSAGNLVCDATLIPPIRTEANLTSQFTVTATIGSIEQFAVLAASSGTVTVTAVKTARITETLTVVATQVTQPLQIVGIVANLSVQGFTVTVGDIINFDPYFTLRILPEDRLLAISAETRDLRIRPESRTLIIEGA